MEQSMLTQFKDAGAIMVLALAALGSGSGAGIAGMAGIGAWKKNFMQNKTASFLLVALTAAPLTQTIYGCIVMNRMLALTNAGQYLWGVGLFAGAAIGLSAYWQGKCVGGRVRRDGGDEQRIRELPGRARHDGDGPDKATNRQSSWRPSHA